MADNAPVLAPGFDAQSLEVKRRRALAKMLQESQMPQGQMVSGHYVAPPLLGSINAVARQLMGAYGERKADEQEAELNKTKRDALIRAVRNETGDKRGFAERLLSSGIPGTEDVAIEAILKGEAARAEAEAKRGRLVSPQEAAQRGLPPGWYNEGDDGLKPVEPPKNHEYSPNTTIVNPWTGERETMASAPPEGMQTWQNGYDSRYTDFKRELTGMEKDYSLAGPAADQAMTIPQFKKAIGLGGGGGGGGQQQMPPSGGVSPEGIPIGNNPSTQVTPENLALAQQYGAELNAGGPSPVSNGTYNSIKMPPPSQQEIAGYQNLPYDPRQPQQPLTNLPYDPSNPATMQPAGGPPRLRTKGELEAEATTLKETATADAKSFAGVLKSGQQAQTNLSKSGIYDRAIDAAAYTGPGAGYVASGKKILQGMGVKGVNATPENMIDAMNKEFVALMQFDEDGNRVLAGQMSDADRQFFESRAPGLTDTKGALKIKKAMLDKVWERQVAIAELAKQNKNNPRAFAAAREQYIAENPLFDDQFIQFVDSELGPVTGGEPKAKFLGFE